MKTEDPLLGTRGQVNVAAGSKAGAAQAESAVFDEARRLEKIFSVFDSSSVLHEFRRTGTTEVAEFSTVVDLAIEWHDRSAGAFHPALQPLLDLWETSAAQGQAPQAKALAGAVAGLGPIGTDHLNFAGLNLNGIAKGWIADRSLDAASRTDDSVTSAWLNLGGDIVHRGEAAVRVGIEDPARPFDNVAPMATVEISNEALATSGGGRRWWDIGGVRYSKVLDPRTGQPTNGIQSATVVAPTAAAADVLATACLVLTPPGAESLVQSERSECFLLCADRTVVATSSRFKRV